MNSHSLWDNHKAYRLIVFTDSQKTKINEHLRLQNRTNDEGALHSLEQFHLPISDQVVRFLSLVSTNPWALPGSSANHNGWRHMLTQSLNPFEVNLESVTTTSTILTPHPFSAKHLLELAGSSLNLVSKLSHLTEFGR